MSPTTAAADDSHDPRRLNMPSNFSTANRMYFLTLAEYGEDDLLIEEMRGQESLSSLFHFNFVLISDQDDIDPRKIIGKWAKLRIETHDIDAHGGERHWSGFVSSFHRTGRTTSADGHDSYTYACELVPWLWFMTRHQDIRIFQNLSIPDIVEKVLTDTGFTDYELQLNETHPQLLYCTQYHETNYAFIARLLERAGIYIYYKHNRAGSRDAQHIVVFTDNVDSNPDMEPPEVLFHHAGMAEGGDAITTLQADFSLRTGKVSVRDWDFMRKAVVNASTPTCIPIGDNDSYEHYHYPGGYVESNLGEYFTKVMMQAEEAAFLTLSGSSQVRQLEPGYKFALEGHPFENFNRDYLVVSVDHYGRNNLTNDGGPAEYRNTFTIQPHDVPFRSPLRTPRPRVYGPQTAIVTGPDGDEIYTDVHGRIKVQFHWDRNGKYNDSSSCWMRVAQVWAGNGYGTMFIPRIGMEVVVDFLEGDPDQPIVTGCVYNGINKPPYTLPADATKSTIKTLSSKGGGGTNELRFEDKKGSEELFLQAEKNLNVNVKATRTENVGGDSNYLIKGHYATKVTGYLLSFSESDYKNQAKGQLWNIALGDNIISSKDGRAMMKGANGTWIESDADVTINAMGGNVIVESPTMVSLKCGGNAIVIDPSGVAIIGSMVRINSGGAPLSASVPTTGLSLDDPTAGPSTKDGKVNDPGQQLQAQALINAAQQGQPFCAECKAARAAYEALMA